MEELKALLPRCCICHALLGTADGLMAFQCRHPVCSRCSQETFFFEARLYVCPIEHTSCDFLVDQTYLTNSIAQVQEEMERGNFSNFQSLKELLRIKINYNSRCLDSACPQQFCPRLHIGPTEQCPHGLDCYRLFCLYAHDRPRLEPSFSVPIVSEVPLRGPEAANLSNFLVHFQRAEAETSVEEGEIPIKSMSLYDWLMSGKPSNLDLTCRKHGARVSLVEFRNSYCVSTTWAFGSLAKPRNFSQEDSLLLESNREIPYGESLKVAEGRVYMSPRVLVVANSAYRPVFRLQQIRSKSFAGKLIVHDRDKCAALESQLQRLEVTSYVANNVDGEDVLEVLRANRLFVEVVDDYHMVSGTKKAIEAAAQKLRTARTIDNVSHIAVHDPLAQKLLAQIVKNLGALLLNLLLIGDRWTIFRANFDQKTFDNSHLKLQFSEEMLRTYNLSVNGAQINGCVEDIVLASQKQSVEQQLVEQLVESAPTVVVLAGRMVEAQLLPPQDQFEDWYFSQAEECKVTTLAQADPDFQRISKLITDKARPIPVLKIEKVQHKQLYLSYLKKMNAIAEKLGKKPEIKQLFHGPRENEPYDMLLKGEGFRRRAGTGSWGIGFYFAEKASKALLYAFFPKDDASRKIMMCDVIVGNSQHMLSNQKMRAPPPGAHSVLGRGRGSIMHIVYEADQALIRYIITLATWPMQPQA